MSNFELHVHVHIQYTAKLHQFEEIFDNLRCLSLSKGPRLGHDLLYQLCLFFGSKYLGERMFSTLNCEKQKPSIL